MPLIVGLMLACAPSAAVAYQTAMDGSRSVSESLSLCEQTGEQMDECAAHLVRTRSDANATDCEQINAEKWRAECFFSVAERHGLAKERWAALQTCGRAGEFYAECLFHVWTYELEATLLPDVHPNRQVHRPLAAIRFWGNIQTIAGQPSEQLWIEWWLLGMKGRTARHADCESLASVDQGRCSIGMTAHVARSMAEFLQNAPADSGATDRVCRGGLAEARAALPLVCDWSASFEPALELAKRVACGRTGTEMQRPWNPIFMERRVWAGG